MPQLTTSVTHSQQSYILKTRRIKLIYQPIKQREALVIKFMSGKTIQLYDCAIKRMHEDIEGREREKCRT